MKLPEFLEKQRAYKARLNQLSYFLLGGIVFGLGVGFILAKSFSEESADLKAFTLVGGLIGIYSGMFVAAGWLKIVKRKSGLFCPGCKIALIGGLGPIAIASSNCGKCGIQVIEK